MTLYAPLQKDYTIQMFVLNAAGFGVPQIRKRVIFVGLSKSIGLKKAYLKPRETHDYSHLKRNKGNLNTPSLFDAIEPIKIKCLGVREALGLSDINYDTLAPTLRCTLTGPRSTTSILSSTSAQNVWNSIEIWPNGVQLTRERASAFPTKNKTFRLAVPDCSVIQGFPHDWTFNGPVYKALGQIGNSVAPPMAYNIAKSIAHVLKD